MNNFNKADIKRLGNIKAFSINSNIEGQPDHEAMMASNRFLNTAALLPKNEFIGWQIVMDGDKSVQNLMFSSKGIKVSEEDYNWMLDKCGVTDSKNSTSIKDIFAEGRTVYELVYVAESSADVSCIPMNGDCYNASSRSYYDDYEDDVSDVVRDNYLKDWFSELFSMFASSGAIIQIVAGASDKKALGHGSVMISLPDRMSLRLKSMITLAMPHLEAHKIPKAGNGTKDDDGLPDERFVGSMIRFMSAMLKHAEENEPESVLLGSENSGEEANNIDAGTDFKKIDIDDLDLSLRTANCLKRAGIHTIDELLEHTEDELHFMHNLGKTSVREVTNALKELGLSLRTECTGIKEGRKYKLDEMIGLDDVKAQIIKLTAFAKMRKYMAEHGKDPITATLNMAFLGNPGTAKTTVARIVADIYKEIGILKDGKVKEVGRADLVAEYEGQTAVKVKKVFKEARGGILFIDEAYSLVETWGNSFGDEAISTIVQEMENNRADTIVIFAGYPDKMEEFLSRNPGLKSRIPFKIAFNDYSVDEMYQIIRLEAKKRGFTIDPDACERLEAICESAVGDTEAGNGRFCRNVVENAILEYALREYGNNKNGVEKSFELKECDFRNAGVLNEIKHKKAIGF